MIWTWLARNPLSTVLLVAVLALSAVAGWLALSRAAVRVDLANAQAQFATYQRDQAAAVGEIAQNSMAEIARQQVVTAGLDVQLQETTHAIDVATRRQRDAARELARLRAEDRSRAGAVPAVPGAASGPADPSAGTGLRLPAEGDDGAGELSHPLTEAEIDRAWEELAAARRQAAGLKQAYDWVRSVRQ